MEIVEKKWQIQFSRQHVCFLPRCCHIRDNTYRGSAVFSYINEINCDIRPLCLLNAGEPLKYSALLQCLYHYDLPE